MAFHDDLLKQALDLAGKNPESPTQADLRRSVSAAYYALFHLLISETVANWRIDSSRDGLARMFEHRVMVKASERLKDSNAFPFAGEDPEVVQNLRMVAKAFRRLQENRHIADYDNARHWTQLGALEEVREAEAAFTAWHAIKNEKVAQDFLVSLLIKPRG
ncbi:MAG: hypothetical protein EXQ57_09765 [Bryobacterales bacterium]|nr:hypothetical protein [Bryobacterales bacterium]